MFNALIIIDAGYRILFVAEQPRFKMDYGGNWPDQNFSDPTYHDDSGPLHSVRRVPSPPATDHPGAGVPRAPRRLGGGSRRPASAGAVEYLSRQAVSPTRGGPAGEGPWRWPSPDGNGSARPPGPRQRRAEALAMALALAVREDNGEDKIRQPHQSKLTQRLALPLALPLALRASSSSSLRSEPSRSPSRGAPDTETGDAQLETNSWAPRDARHSRGWPFKDPFPMELCPLSRQSLRGSQNMCTDLAVASVNRVSPVSPVRPSSPVGGNKSVSFNSDPYIPEKQHWQTRYPNDILCYNQELEHILPERKWNLYKDASSDNKHPGKEVLPDPGKWQFREDRESSAPVLQQLSLANAAPGRSLSPGRQDTSIKENRDYEALIRNMEEVEEREINACLRDEDFVNQMDVTDGNDISVRVDTVMLENFEELEQLIQEEDDDVQMALRIQDRQSSLIKGKKTQNDGLDSPKPVYQGNSVLDDSDDDLSPEVAAAMMHSEEQGILMGSAPSRVYNALFSDCEKDLIAVSSACPFLHQSVVVPSAVSEMPYTASAEDLTALASATLGEEPPNSSVFSETLKKRGSYDAVLTEASKTYSNEQDADSPDRVLSAPPERAIGRNLEYVLDPASPSAHFSKVQLRGSNLPDWFPGYYKALPHIKGITAVCSDPGIVMEDAWWTLQTTIS